MLAVVEQALDNDHDDPPGVTGTAPMPDDCTRQPDGSITCDGISLEEWCSLAYNWGESLCYGSEYGGNGPTGGSGSPSGGSNSRPEPPPPVHHCLCGAPTPVFRQSSRTGLPTFVRWQCPSLVFCSQEAVGFTAELACESAAVAAGAVCTVTSARLLCSIVVGAGTVVGAMIDACDSVEEISRRLVILTPNEDYTP